MQCGASLKKCSPLKSKMKEAVKRFPPLMWMRSVRFLISRCRHTYSRWRLGPPWKAGGKWREGGCLVQPHTCTGFHSAAKKGLLHSQLGWGHVMKTAFRLSRPVPESVLTLPLRCTVQPFFIPRYFHNLGKHWVFCRPGRRRGVRSGLGLSGRLCSFSSVPGTESCARQMLWKYVLVG